MPKEVRTREKHRMRPFDAPVVDPPQIEGHELEPVLKPEPGSVLKLVSAIDIVEKYNEAIEIAKTEPLSVSASKNPIICSIETVIGNEISHRLRENDKTNIDDDDDGDVRVRDPPIHKSMCSCRMTTLVLFVMFYLNISIPSAPPFLDTYWSLKRNLSDNIKLVHNGFINLTQMKNLTTGKEDEDIKFRSDYYSGGMNRLDLESFIDMNIVYIYKLIRGAGGAYWGLMHSFIIRNNQKKDHPFELISSWCDVLGESPATGLIYNAFTFEDLQTILTPYSLLVKENSEKIFGKGNFFDREECSGKLTILFVSKDGLLKGLTAGSKTKKKHRSKKNTKRKKKKKHTKCKKKKKHTKRKKKRKSKKSKMR